MREIEQWLTRIGLSQYGPLFIEQGIDLSVVPDLRNEDLKELGIPLGHRKRLLRAISELVVGATVLPGPSGAAPASRDASDSSDAERRQITVLFCDLVGSTQLSTQLDPEDLSTLLGTYRRCCAETVGRWDGYVAKYMGDGMLAYFGWPRAHEDDAERAVRAGLELVEAVGRLDTAGGTRLAARVGMATGEVVVGDLIGERAAREHNVVGETPNLAARMQAVAQAGTVVIDSRTRRLLGNLFELRSLGQLALKGFADSVTAYEVLRKSATESRFEALHAQQTPLVGREEEIDLLLRRWEQARQGEGHVVMLSGEAGIGKSRLCAELLERLAHVPHMRLRYSCSPHHTTSPLHPFIAQLERAADFASDDSPATRFGKVAATLVPAAAQPGDAALLAELLSIPPGEHYEPLALVPEQKKERTLAALLGQLEGLAATKPVLMLFEDLHWIDPTSRELLERTIDRVERLPVLLVLTFRPEFEPPWLGQAHVSMHTLRKLDSRESAALIDLLTGGKRLPPEVAQQIIEHTDGVPLFTEELTKAVLEGTLLVEEADRYVLTGPLPPLAIPTTLQASLMARLDRLSSFKEFAQVGAAIGRDFSYELLAAVTGSSEAELQRALARLVEAELLFCCGAPPRGSLMFKHALVQDAAYASLLRSRRQELHARITRVLEGSFPDTVEAQPELLAHHCARAGLVECAIDYWQRAGERALERSANQEAMQHFGSGIELIKGLPVTPARRRQEFRLHLGLGPAVRAVKGHAAPETLHAFSLARDLIDDNTSMPEQMRVLYGLWGVQFARGEHEAGRAVAEQALSLVAGRADAEAQALANRLLGETLWAMGEFVKARHHLERAIDFCGADQASVTDLRFSFDHKIGALSFLGWTLWSLGHQERASAVAAEALTLSSQVKHAATTAMALSGSMVLSQFRRDARDLYERAGALARHCAEHGIGLFGLWGRFSEGLARSWNGDPLPGIEAMRVTMEIAERAYAEVFRPMHLGFLGETYARIGERERARELLDEAIERAAKTSEGYFEAELHRMRGELLLAHDETAAEASFDRALSIARRQGAKSWELRTAVSLARLWRDRGDNDRARDLLAPIYGWFAEGFDAPDLLVARALLDEIQSA